MKKINLKSKNFKKKAISLVVLAIILTSGIFPFFEDFLFVVPPKIEETSNNRKIRQNYYDPYLPNYLYWNYVDDTDESFNANGECYVLADVNGTDFTSFELDGETYDVSYGINIFPVDFETDSVSHDLILQQQDVDDKNYEWITVEPLFIKQNNITVDLNSSLPITFNAGGPISILMQPNFSYNWLYLEVDGVVINDIYDTAEYPEIDSAFFSYFIEDGAYIRFDLDMRPEEHVMNVKGNGSIEYKILVNLDWDEDLLHDVDEIQKELFDERYDPTIKNIWGFFERSEEFSYDPDGVGTAKGYFTFYLPEDYSEYNYLFIDIHSGNFSNFKVDDDDLTLKNFIITTDYLSGSYCQPYGVLEPGYHNIYYEYHLGQITEISFRIGSQKIMVLDKPEFKDSDSDGLKDAEERNSGLDPYNRDTDGDGMPDNIDASPLTSLELDKDKMHQIILPANKENNTMINLVIRKPSIDYSTQTTPRLWRGIYNVSIMMAMRLFGNESITRDELVGFWKDDPTNVETYCLIEGEDGSGEGDAIPVSDEPNAEFTFIFAKSSEETFDFDITYPKGHLAKSDDMIDLRFDFIWLVTYYNESTKETNLLHYYNIEENLILISMNYQEIGNVSYILASPDTMIENQILWALTQNPQLGSSSDYDVSNDIVGEGMVDYLHLAEEIMQVREEHPILVDRNFIGEQETAIIRPNGDVYHSGFSQDPLYSRIDEEVLEPNGGDGLEIIGDRLSCDYEIDFSSLQMGNGKGVNKIILHVLGYATTPGYLMRGCYYINSVWGGSTKDIELDVGSDSWKTIIWENNEDFELCLSQQELDSLTFRFFIYNIDANIHIEAVYAEVFYQTYEETPLENEVLYVAGLQSNLDVLNKINIKQNIPNPSFEVNHSGEFQSYFSYYSVSNVYEMEGQSSYEESLWGDHKICYIISWNNYSYDTTFEYEQRANIQGLPISMEIITFASSTVLKITQAMGSEIPLDQIPISIEFELHDKINFWNQTYIELFESIEGIPQLKFDNLRDIYKEFISDRPWEVETSRLIFNEYSEPLVSIINKFYERTRVDFDDMFAGLLRIDEHKELFNHLISIGYFERFRQIDVKSFTFKGGAFNKFLRTLGKDFLDIDQLNGWELYVYHTKYVSAVLGSDDFTIDVKISALKNWYKLNKLNDLTEIEKSLTNKFNEKYKLPEYDVIFGNDDELFSDLIEIQETLEIKYDDLKILDEFSDMVDPDNNLPCWKEINSKLTKNQIKAIGAAYMVMGTFQAIYGIANMINFFIHTGDYEGREIEFGLRIAGSLGMIGMGVLTATLGYLIWKNFEEVLKEGIEETFPKLAKSIPILGYILDVIFLISDIFELYATLPPEDFNEALEALVLYFVTFDLILPMLLSLANPVAGLLFELVINLLSILKLFCPPPPPDIQMIENESHVIFPVDNIKKHGSLEVGDRIGLQMAFQFDLDTIESGNPGDPEFGYLRARFALLYDEQSGYSWSPEEGYWTERWSYQECLLDPPLPCYVDDDIALLQFDQLIIGFPTYELKTLTEVECFKAYKDYQSMMTHYIYVHYPDLLNYQHTQSLGLPVLDKNIENFYDDTIELPKVANIEQLKTIIGENMANFQWKDAQENLDAIQQIEPGYTVDLPISTNINTDLQEDILELNPSTSWDEFSLNLEGNDNPLVDYSFSLMNNDLFQFELRDLLFKESFDSNIWQLYDAPNPVMCFSSIPTYDRRTINDYFGVRYISSLSDNHIIAHYFYDYETKCYLYCKVEEEIPYLEQRFTGDSYFLGYFEYAKDTNLKIYALEPFDDSSISGLNPQPDVKYLLVSQTMNDLEGGWKKLYFDTTDRYFEFKNPIEGGVEGTSASLRSTRSSYNKPTFNYLLSKNYQENGMIFMQTDMTETLNYKSPVYASDIQLETGSKINIRFKTMTSDEIYLHLFNNGVNIKTVTILTSGNQNFEEQVVSIIMDEDVSIDQLMISAQMDKNEILEVYDIEMYSPFRIQLPVETRYLDSSMDLKVEVLDPAILGGIYYFDMNITLHDTGELIYSEHVPFRISFVRDLSWTQSNIVFHEEFSGGLLELNAASPIYLPMTTNTGQIINIRCNTNTSNEVLLHLYDGGTLIKEMVVFPRGNLALGNHFVQLIMDEDITFDQFGFSGILEEYESFTVKELEIMDSLIYLPPDQVFTPLEFTNDGNVPEFVEVSFSGISFDHVDTSIYPISVYPAEFRGERQFIMLMPGTSRICEFNISEPTESISNQLWRGITAIHPGTREIFTNYVDSLAFDGIYINNPRNTTYNIFGKSLNAEEDLLLDVIPEVTLAWTAYSLDGQPNITFSGTTYVPVPEFDGLHSIQVFGEDSLGAPYQSEIRYFSINYPIKISCPENTTYVENSGLTLNVSSIKSLDWSSYSLDDQIPIEITDEVTLPVLADGVHSIVVYGIDIYGNDVRSEKRLFTVDTDLTPPSITSVQVSDDPLKIGNLQAITCVVSDPSGIHTVEARVMFNDGTEIAAIFMVNTAVDVYEGTWDSTGAVEGAYYIDILAYDSSYSKNNWTESNAVQFDAELMPTASFTVSSTSISVDQAVMFTFTGDEGDALATFLWDFGDGQTSTERDPTHQYAAAGFYTITLTVTDADGDVDVISITDYIEVTEAAPATPFIIIVMVIAFIGVAFLMNKRVKKRKH